MNVPSSYELLLYLMELNGGSFQGKTNIHKNIYLLQKMMPKVELPIRFKPYFYGPYSQDISEALDLLQNGGLLQVNQLDFGVKDSFEVRKYVYHLTPYGEIAAAKVGDSFGEFADQIKVRFEKLKSTKFHENTKVLSTAAKVKHILSTEKKPLNTNSIKSKAKELGWKINDRDLSASVKVLVDIGLATSSTK